MLLTANEVIQTFFKPLAEGNKNKITDTKLYRLAKLGKIPSLKLDGRVYFDEDTLRVWFRSESEVKSTPDVLNHYGRNRCGALRTISED